MRFDAQPAARRCALLVLLVLAAELLVTGAAALGASETEAPRAADAANEAVVSELARLVSDLDRWTTLREDKEAELREARADAASAQAGVNATQGRIVVNGSKLVEVEARVRERGVAAYTQSAAVSSLDLDVNTASELNAARTYTKAAALVDTSLLTDLRAEATRLNEELAERMRIAQASLDTSQSLEARVQELTQRIAAATSALQRAGAVTVMGPAQLTAAQLANWYRSTGATPNLAEGTSIDDLAALYIEEGSAEGVRGDYAFVQAIVETGYFRVAAGNNFSGIGVCDSCTGGYAFPTPRDGVRTQIQLLRNYADPDSRAKNLAHRPSPGLYGEDPEKAARLYDTFFLKGKAPLWNLMGGGNWATDPVYAPKIIALHARIVTWAATQPEAVRP